MSKYQLECREAGRRRWRVVWRGHSELVGGEVRLFKTFRSRYAAERWIEKQTPPPPGDAYVWRPAPERPQSRLPEARP